jgi:PTH1 family peptidyl-tRNA hydrolase
MISMTIIAGLGNPGDKYRNTRHNIGWIALSYILEKHNFPSLVKSAKYAGAFSEGMLEGKEIGLLFPMTFMNNSGASVCKYLKDHGDNLNDLIVIHDEVDLPFGDIKISYYRGAGGHNGIRSIIDACGGQKFARIRVGVAKKGIFGNVKRPTGDKLSDFVLGEFKKGDEKILGEIKERVDEAILLILKEGVEKAMQEMNK